LLVELALELVPAWGGEVTPRDDPIQEAALVCALGLLQFAQPVGLAVLESAGVGAPLRESESAFEQLVVPPLALNFIAVAEGA
jgi:hypothetical protein